MKNFQLFVITFLLGTFSAFSQQDSLPVKETGKYKITIEPGIGISPMPIVDMNLSNIIQVGITKRFSIISYTSIKENSLFKRNFNYIKTTNNHSLTQNLGMGTSFYTRRSIHTVSLLAGIKYDTYHESLDNPKFEKVDVTIKSLSPDMGMMYNLKLGRKKYFFSYRMYIPLNPYPLRSRDLNAIDGNLSTISLEMGVGIRLK
jgi:hypothetical protein